MKTPLDYAKAACETMMRKFAAPDLPPKPQFHYHQGVFLSGMMQTYDLCGDERYYQYMKDWIDSVFDEQGMMVYHHPAVVDDVMPGILLYRLMDRTQDPYYAKCLASVYAEMKAVPRNSQGGYWHDPKLVDQMWLDGLYMAGPFCAEYGTRFAMPEWHKDVVLQATLMEKVTRDETTGLLYHAWDGTKTAAWADPETGRSPEFWGRSIGWVPVALLNELDFFERDEEGYADLARVATDLLRSVCNYQSEDGRWYQVVDKGDQPDNWLENSCSCLYVAGICKAVRKGLMDKKYLEQAKKGYEGVIRSLTWVGEDIQIGNVCIGTSVGNYQHYIARPTSTNDLHGVGAFLIMCTEMQMVLDDQAQ